MDSADVMPPSASPARRFGRFELRQLLSKNTMSYVWVAHDTGNQADVLLCVPRAQPKTDAERDAWSQEVLLASRLKHPRLAQVLDVGIHEGWPYAAYERGTFLTLHERMQPSHPLPTVLDIVNWTTELLEALAYAHEAGAAHKDLALVNVMLDGAGHVRVAGLAVGLALPRPGVVSGDPTAGSNSSRQAQRVWAERDVLMAGLLLHRLLAGHPALDDPDLSSASTRVGPEIVRLPWNTPQPIAETLRAIVNRATDRQQRQRYLNARTLISALQGWVKTNSQESSGPLALIMDRLETVGHLPSRSRDMGGILKVFTREELRVDDMVNQIVLDPALCWELLRSVNTARYQTGGNEDPSCSLSRAIVLLGQQGLRKVCGALRTWPGVLQAASSLQGSDAGQVAEAALETELKRACIAALAARWLRPFNIGDEEAMMVAMSQHLGRLLILYHFPEESAQINRLTMPGPPTELEGKPAAGMTLEAATGAVLGVNPDELTAAVLRYWGFPEYFIQAARPLSQNVPPRRPEGPNDWLRLTASLANELCELVEQPAVRQNAMLTKLMSRYARPALTSQKELVEALQRSVKSVDLGLYRRTFSNVQEPGVATPVAQGQR
jgi:eukaryotic-like serine/threonine-protein kinase